MPTVLHITSVPPGEAPLWVREKWVGLTLSLAQRKTTPLSFLTGGVLSGPRNVISGLCAFLQGKLERQSGFLIEGKAAIEILAASSPEAAAWWQTNTPHLLRPKRYFVFQEGTGHVETLA